MGKPSIGAAVTPTAEKKTKREVKVLTVLKDDSKESIYQLIFCEKEKGGLK